MDLAESLPSFMVPSICRKLTYLPIIDRPPPAGLLPDLTHGKCPRNTVGASDIFAREMVTLVRHGKLLVDDAHTSAAARR